MQLIPLPVPDITAGYKCLNPHTYQICLKNKVIGKVTLAINNKFVYLQNLQPLNNKITNKFFNLCMAMLYDLSSKVKPNLIIMAKPQQKWLAKYYSLGFRFPDNCKFEPFEGFKDKAALNYVEFKELYEQYINSKEESINLEKNILSHPFYEQVLLPFAKHNLKIYPSLLKQQDINNLSVKEVLQLCPIYQDKNTALKLAITNNTYPDHNCLTGKLELSANSFKIWQQRYKMPTKSSPPPTAKIDKNYKQNPSDEKTFINKEPLSTAINSNYDIKQELKKNSTSLNKDLTAIKNSINNTNKKIKSLESIILEMNVQLNSLIAKLTSQQELFNNHMLPPYLNKNMNNKTASLLAQNNLKKPRSYKR